LEETEMLWLDHIKLPSSVVYEHNWDCLIMTSHVRQAGSARGAAVARGRVRPEELPILDA
jgi:hypothetical protein